MRKGLSTRLTASDWFCGAGGSSEGAVAAGVEVVAAANHWELAIETHNTNHPHTDHYLTNLSQADPRYFPTTNILWASPECTNHSLAKGKKRKNIGQKSLFDPGKIDPSEERSRATMWCVPRFAEYHGYDVVIVENVVDIRYWVTWPAWLQAMDLLGYNYDVCYFNSMFFNPVNGISDYAPQSRDRIYIVFWKKGNRKPNLDFRPLAWCVHCERNVQAVQAWKNPQKRWGRYGKQRQYVYRCPGCAGVVDPYYYAAWNCVDWRIEAPRIGDRQKPLKPRTMERIRIGLEKYGRQPLQIQLGHSHCTHPENRVKALDEPMPTQTTRQTMAVLVRMKGDIASSGRRIIDPLPTQTTVGTPCIVSMKGVPGYNEWPVTAAMPTQTTEGSPYILSMYGQSNAQSIDAPLGTATTQLKHALVMPQPFVATYYGGSNVLSGVAEPVTTVRTVPAHSLVVPEGELKIEDCGFRMFEPHEIRDAMGFRDDYVLLGTKRQRVKLSGNAVTPPVAEWLFKQCVETFN